MRKLIPVILSFVVAGMLSTTAQAEGKVKIGVSTALTGGAATYGLDIKDALEFANKKFGNGKYKLIFEDDKCDPKTAITVANKLINADKVSYVLGFACSGTVLATAPVYERAKRIVITSSASSPKIADAGEYIFRTTPSDIQAAKQLHRQISKTRKVLAILSEESEYAQDLAEAFSAANEESSALKIVSETFLPDNVDFKTLLARLRQKNPDALFINTQTDNGFVVILKQLHEMGWQVPVYGAYWPGSNAVLSQAGELADGIEYVDTPSLSGLLSEEGAKVFAEFLQEYPKPRSIESVFASSLEAFRALDLAHQSGVDVKEFLLNEKFTGIFGSYEFDKKGEIIGIDFEIKKIVNGKPTVVKQF